MNVLKVYRRDASWHVCGHGGSASRYHFEGEDCASACGRARLLELDHPHDPKDVPFILRCRAKGCRERWAKIPILS